MVSLTFSVSLNKNNFKNAQYDVDKFTGFKFFISSTQ